MHREGQCVPNSAGLHTLQQLSTAPQELPRKLLFCSNLCGMLTKSQRPPRSGQCFTVRRPVTMSRFSISYMS